VVTLVVSSDFHNFIPFKFVLQASLANCFGNKSLYNSGYNAFKMVKKKEIETGGMILMELAKKQKNIKDLPAYLLKSAEQFANPLKELLISSMVLKAWIR
jgi:hypothetical protein